MYIVTCKIIHSPNVATLLPRVTIMTYILVISNTVSDLVHPQTKPGTHNTCDWTMYIGWIVAARFIAPYSYPTGIRTLCHVEPWTRIRTTELFPSHTLHTYTHKYTQYTTYHIVHNTHILHTY